MGYLDVYEEEIWYSDIKSAYEESCEEEQGWTMLCLFYVIIQPITEVVG